MTKATFIFGSDAVRHYDQTGKIPDPETFNDMGCLITQKEFSSQKHYDTYVEALEDYDGFDDYRVIDLVETKETDLDSRIKDFMREGPLAALYLKIGIDVLQEVTSKMSDEELYVMFGSLLPVERLRGNIREAYNRLNDFPDDHQPE
jgi:hypothetical protein